MPNLSADSSCSSDDSNVYVAHGTDVFDAERVLMMTDRIMVLENKLAEAKHRYESTLHFKRVEEHEEREAQRSKMERRYPRIARIYGRSLRLPLVGAMTRNSVRLVKRLLPGGSGGAQAKAKRSLAKAPDEQSARVARTRLENATESFSDESDVN